MPFLAIADLHPESSKDLRMLSLLDAELKFPHALGKIYQSAIELAVERLNECPLLS